MFQFRAFPSYDYLIHRTILEYCSSVLPHSEISGSKLICSSPKLIAACRVLHRLLMPRHSPCALISLTFVRTNCALLRPSPLREIGRRTSAPLRSPLPTNIRFATFPLPFRLTPASLGCQSGYRFGLYNRFSELCRFQQKFISQNCIYPFD